MPSVRSFPAILAASIMLSGCGNPLFQSDTAAAEAKDVKSSPRAESPDTPAPRIAPMTHLAAGQMLERQGDFLGAIEQYEKAVASNPRFTTAYNRLGIVYQRLGKLDEAVNILRQGIKAGPDSAILHNNLAYCLLTQNRLVEAESECRLALRASPDFQRARMNLAITLARADRLEESLAEFSQVVPPDVAHYNVGVIRLGEQDYAAAEKAFFDALALNPNCAGAKAYLDRTRRLASESADGKRVSPPPVDAPLAGQLGDEAPAPSP